MRTYKYVVQGNGKWVDELYPSHRGHVEPAEPGLYEGYGVEPGHYPAKWRLQPNGVLVMIWASKVVYYLVREGDLRTATTGGAAHLNSELNNGVEHGRHAPSLRPRRPGRRPVFYERRAVAPYAPPPSILSWSLRHGRTLVRLGALLLLRQSVRPRQARNAVGARAWRWPPRYRRDAQMQRRAEIVVVDSRGGATGAGAAATAGR